MRSRLACALAVGVLVPGCSLKGEGLGDDTPLGDSTVTLDEGPPTDLGIDSLVAEDTSAADTEPADGMQVDAPSDVAETSVDALIDAPADVVPTGSLTVTGAPTSAFPVDLTAEGTIGWAHWGFLNADSVTRKIGSGAIINASTVSPTRGDAFPVGFTWSDGDPNGAATATKTGVSRFTGTESFEFDVIAGTEARTLRVYVASDTVKGRLTFTLSDASAKSAMIDLPVAGTPGGAGHRPQIVTARYGSATSGARLRVSLIKASPGTGSVSLFAATVF